MYLHVTHGMNAQLSKQLLMGRTHGAYESIAEARNSDSVVSMTKTPKNVLVVRDTILHSIHGSAVHTSIVSKSHVTKSTSTRVYRSIYQCVTSDTSMGGIWTWSVTPKESNDTKVPFIYPDCYSVGYMSPTLGMEGPCNILMRTGDSWTELHDEQPVNPLLHIDNSGHLDPLVELEFTALLHRYSHTTPLTNVFKVNTVYSKLFRGIQKRCDIELYVLGPKKCPTTNQLGTVF
jgi:hypothetical protein